MSEVAARSAVTLQTDHADVGQDADHADGEAGYERYEDRRSACHRESQE
jgi:hypothetical protein